MNKLKFILANLLLIILFSVFSQGLDFTSRINPTAFNETSNLTGFCASQDNTANTSHSVKWYKNGILNKTTILDVFYKAENLTGPTDHSIYRVGAIDPNGTFGYFGTETAPVRLAKIDLRNITVVANMTGTNNENFTTGIAIDRAGNFLYLKTSNNPVTLIKINLTDFTRIANFTIPQADFSHSYILIDPQDNFLYLASYWNRQVIKINLTSFSFHSNISLQAGEEYSQPAVMHPSGTYIYYGTTFYSPARIIRVNLTNFARVDAITLNTDENSTRSVVIDPLGDFAYFGTETTPCRIVKINLTTFTRVGSITLNSGENGCSSASIDPFGRFAYFGTNTFQVVKINLTSFTRVQSINISGTGGAISGIMDPHGRFTYFGTFNGPSKVHKIVLQQHSLPNVERNIDNITTVSDGNWTLECKTCYYNTSICTTINSSLTIFGISSRCSYSGIGDWVVSGSDNCILRINTNLYGNSILFNLTGTATILANITNFSRVTTVQTTVTTSQGGRLG